MDIYEQQVHLDTDLSPCKNISSEWIIDLDVKCNAIKFEESLGENLHDLGFGDEILKKCQNQNPQVKYL